METYVEHVNQFVVEYQETMDDRRKAEYRLHGIDPDTLWTLKYSYTTLEHAQARADADQAWHNDFCKEHGYTPWKTYRVRDLGSPVEIERQAWF